MKIHYLEIVTPEVDEACMNYAKLHNVTFTDADPFLGGARTAELSNGGKIGIRGPMRDDELPVVRHYLLVDAIQATVDAAATSGVLAIALH